MIFKSEEEKTYCFARIEKINNDFFTPVIQKFNVRKSAGGKLPSARLALITSEVNNTYNIYLVFDDGKADILIGKSLPTTESLMHHINQDILQSIVQFAAKGPRYFHRKFKVNASFI